MVIINPYELLLTPMGFIKNNLLIGWLAPIDHSSNMFYEFINVTGSGRHSILPRSWPIQMFVIAMHGHTATWKTVAFGITRPGKLT